MVGAASEKEIDACENMNGTIMIENVAKDGGASMLVHNIEA
jgi:hypothetical protein